MAWRSRSRKVREIEMDALQYVDGVRSASRWGKVVEAFDDNDSEYDVLRSASPHSNGAQDTYARDSHVDHITPLTRKPSGRSKGRPSMGDGGVSSDGHE
jgi:hypothetical protein